MIIPARLKKQEKIGLISCCHYADKDAYSLAIRGIQKLGFQVKEGANLYKKTWSYAASLEERLDDFNAMLYDESVAMIMFGGGHVGNDLLPVLDFELIQQHPKIICSYSNGTAMLNIIYLNTGLEVYYGQFLKVFKEISEFDYFHFSHHLMETPHYFQPQSTWHALSKGKAEGILIGGFSESMALLVNHPLFHYDKNRKYILFLENNEKFKEPAEIAYDLAWIEQSPFFHQVSGLFFGNYAEEDNETLNRILIRFGHTHFIPVVKCDDFGHGLHHGILPIGKEALLDADALTLTYKG